MAFGLSQSNLQARASYLIEWFVGLSGLYVGASYTYYIHLFIGEQNLGIFWLLVINLNQTLSLLKHSYCVIKMKYRHNCVDHLWK